MRPIKITEEEFAKHRDNTAVESKCPHRDGRIKIEKACYCGHTDLCECLNPDILTMQANTKKTLVYNIPTLDHNDI